jgi:hypothetical protein
MADKLASSRPWQAQSPARPADHRPDLLQLARRLDRLCPSATRPDYFHEEKSEIAFQLRRLAKVKS